MKLSLIIKLIALQLLLHYGMAGMVFGDDTDLNTHSAYKVTSYDLGAIQGFLNKNKSQNRKNFEPLFITKSAANNLNSEHQITVSLGEPDSDQASISSFAVSAQFDATSKISIHGAFGISRNLWTPDLFDSVNGPSWEANFGIIYKLLNNVSYELHFGYMETGDLFHDQSSYSDVENIIMINNKLSLSF